MVDNATRAFQTVRDMIRLVKPGSWSERKEPFPHVFAEIVSHEDGSYGSRDKVPAPSELVTKCLPSAHCQWVHQIGDLIEVVARLEHTSLCCPPPR